MILVVVKHQVRSKYADECPSLLEELTTSTRAEPGNISFDWLRSPEDSNLWVLVELFRDAEAGEVHVQSAHFKAATEQLPHLLASIPEIIHVDAPGDGWSRVSEGS
jgi:quinol monooxygenase YgiN